MPAKPLPARPHLEQYKKQAKELLKAWKAHNPAALALVAQFHPHASRSMTLADMQLVLAREHGFESWPKFAQRIQEKNPADGIWREAANTVLRGDEIALEALLRDHGDVLRGKYPRVEWWIGDFQGDARSMIARHHSFESWGAFASFREAARQPQSAVARFEAAVDAIVSGDLAALERLLRNEPALVQARSPRTHHATLLHYVGANGVEGFRQRTPKNIVQVTEVLLNAGAEIAAMADMYGGSDTLGLVATSVHPQRAGVQQALMEFLLARGASVSQASGGAKSSSLVNACLANGRPEAAEFLAGRGAPLDLEAAAGLGRLDLVKSLWNGSTERQVWDGFSWACAYGRTEVVAFLLEKGMDIGARLRSHGQTGLHWAAHGGHAEIVRVLLRHGAPLEVQDESFESTPLAWALHGWSTSTDDERYYQVVALLVEAGAKVEERWLPLARDVRDDPRMHSLLGAGS